MSSSEAQAISYFKQIYGVNCSFVAILAVYIYERVITLDQEIAVVWRRRIAGATVLYVSINFFTLAFLMLQLGDWLDLGCQSGYIVTVAYYATEYVLDLLFGVTSALRVYAINGRDWRLPSVIFSLSLVQIATNIYYCSHLTYINAPPPVGCEVFGAVSPTVDYKLNIATRVCVVVADALVLVATWYVTYGVRKGAGITEMKVPVSTLLLRDGTIYFGAVLLINIIDIVLWYTSVFEDMAFIVDVFTSILLSRLFLNLRQVNALTGEDSTVSKMSDVKFASRVIGDLAAPLDHEMSFGDSASNAQDTFTLDGSAEANFGPHDEESQLSDIMEVSRVA